MNDSIGDIFKWIARHKYLAVTSEIEELNEQHDALETKLEVLDRDVEVMEKVAREKYDMQLDNEEVFIVED